MTTVCFTGKGLDRGGRIVNRSIWEAMAIEMGWGVANKVDRNTHILVASRDNTVKALAAAADGTRIMNYRDFEAAHSAGGPYGSGSALDDPFVPDDRDLTRPPVIDTEAEAHPLFGMM